MPRKKKVSMTISPDLLGKIAELRTSIPLARLVPASVWLEALLTIGLEVVVKRMKKGESLEAIFKEYHIPV